MANRFEDKSNALRIVTALVILVFFTLYCASGVVAGARLFENMFGMPYNVALWVGAACTIAYVLIGGFFGRELDGHHPGLADDHRLAAGPRHGLAGLVR